MSHERAVPELEAELAHVLRMLARERLRIDEAAPGHTTFLSHLGAQRRLTDAPWIAHRNLLHALTLANLSRAQRVSLARAVGVEFGQEFGVGRLRFVAEASGLPCGGASLWSAPRVGGPSCIYAWDLGVGATGRPCDWMVLRATASWAAGEGPRVVDPRGLEMLSSLGGEILLLVDDPLSARLVAQACGERVAHAVHPRFAAHVEHVRGDAGVRIWPWDALASAGLRGRKVVAIVLVDAPEAVRNSVASWVLRQRSHGWVPELVEARCPGKLTRAGLLDLWRACAEPRVLLRGDPTWTRTGAAWLREAGVDVRLQAEANQLALL